MITYSRRFATYLFKLGFTNYTIEPAIIIAPSREDRNPSKFTFTIVDEAKYRRALYDYSERRRVIQR